MNQDDINALGEKLKLATNLDEVLAVLEADTTGAAVLCARSTEEEVRRQRETKVLEMLNALANNTIGRLPRAKAHRLLAPLFTLAKERVEGELMPDALIDKMIANVRLVHLPAQPLPLRAPLKKFVDGYEKSKPVLARLRALYE